MFWIKWTHGIYMKNSDDIWTRIPQTNCNW